MRTRGKRSIVDPWFTVLWGISLNAIYLSVCQTANLQINVWLTVFTSDFLLWVLRRVLAPLRDHGLRSLNYLTFWSEETGTWLIKEIGKKCTTFLVGFAALLCRKVIFRRPETTKITEKQVHKNRNRYKGLGIVIHCVLKFRFHGLKIAVNTVVTLEGIRRTDSKGELVMLFSHCRHAVTT